MKYRSAGSTDRVAERRSYVPPRPNQATVEALALGKELASGKNIVLPFVSDHILRSVLRHERAGRLNLTLDMISSIEERLHTVAYWAGQEAITYCNISSRKAGSVPANRRLSDEEQDDLILEDIFNAMKPLANAKGLVGIEIEAEFPGHIDLMDVYSPLHSWDQKGDGSLRGGWEFVSPPLPAPVAFDEVSIMLQGLDAQGADSSHRCGLHVHIDLSHLETDDPWGHFELQETIDRFLVQVFYLMGEEGWNRVLPMSRASNRYCALTKQDWCGSRYYAVNLHSFEKYGTVEIRLGSAEGKFDAEYIRQVQAWIKYLVEFFAPNNPSSWTEVDYLSLETAINRSNYLSFGQASDAFCLMCDEGLQEEANAAIVEWMINNFRAHKLLNFLNNYNFAERNC